ncbi:MAG: slipin family protein [Thermodesulfobacteriota bacterium]
MVLGTVKIQRHEKGLLFEDREFKKVLDQGYYWKLGVLSKKRVDIVSTRDPWLEHKELDLIVASGELKGRAQVVELADSQRGLVWIENRFARVLGPGQYVLWKDFKEVRVEVVDASEICFSHPALNAILESDQVEDELNVSMVEEGMEGVLFVDGVLRQLLAAGRHAFWRRMGKVRILHVDKRECLLDISGQEIMTRDKVSLRLNGLVTFRVVDPVCAVTAAADYQQALYRETQLALRALVGTTELDELLADKDALAMQVKKMVAARVKDLGLELLGFGIRDIILPGEMKELLNKVVESKKAAEANLITRREETAAMRSQANTAKLLTSNPTLMRLRELEVLEKVASAGQLNVVCGDNGIADRVMKLI